MSRKNLIPKLNAKIHSAVTDEVVMETIKSEGDRYRYRLKDINRTDRIGGKTENKQRPIIVKFAKYLEKRKVFNSKED